MKFTNFLKTTILKNFFKRLLLDLIFSYLLKILIFFQILPPKNYKVCKSETVSKKNFWKNVSLKLFDTKGFSESFFIKKCLIELVLFLVNQDHLES